MDSTNNPFLNTIRLPVQASSRLVVIFVVMHVLSVFMPLISGLPTYQKLCLMLLPLFSFLYFRNKIFLPASATQVSELILDAEDQWQVKMLDGMTSPALLGKTVFVHPLLVIIPLKFRQGRHHFIFTPEFVDEDIFRRLRVRLRYKISWK